MYIEALFGLVILGTVLFALQAKVTKNIWDLPMVLAALFCFGAAGYGFFKLAFQI